MLLHRRDELDQSIALSGALDQPDIVIGHRFAVTFSELLSGAVDEGVSFVALALQRVQMACVGDEYRAHQASFSELG
ncbi:MAG TPA: hypothetical protein VF328_14000 [Mycobacterium sp.]|jgi:hypothetical protein